MRSRRSSRAGALLAWAALSALAIACGARTELPTPGSAGPPRSSAFCAQGDYDGGYTSLGIYVLLDKSLSMDDDMKWDEVTAALSAFTDDPAVAGLGMGLQFFPRGSECSEEAFVVPAVPIQPLPGNAAKIKAALAAQAPDGDTPTLPALRGAIEYARASRLGDPSTQILVALATDGSPNACDSTTEAVASVAAQGATTEPQVLTFVIGLETGYLNALEKIAAAGGTGAPIVIGKDATTAQKFVDALKSVREAAAECRYAIPSTGDVVPAPNDLAVSVALSAGATPAELGLVGSQAACAGKGSAFYLDDPAHPKFAILCPGACGLAHASPGSRVSVIAGCGDGSHPHVPPPDAGDCSGAVGFSCVSVCGGQDFSVPACVGGVWSCPEGKVSTTDCGTCAPVPHGCCKPDGTLAIASCVSGAWVCPPGATIFGSGTCKPPAVCAPSLPCPAGDYCRYLDFGCGYGGILGTCAAVPASCPGPAAPVCGCDALVHATACAAASAGQDLANGACPSPDGDFACGPLFCTIATEICRKTKDLTKVVAPNSYDCIPKPPGCPTGCGCSACGPCPPGKKCGEFCSIDPSGGSLLTCQEI